LVINLFFSLAEAKASANLFKEQNYQISLTAYALYLLLAPVIL